MRVNLPRFLLAGAIAATSLAMLGGCASATGTAATAAESEQAASLVVSGAFTYRERIALPPQSRALVELQEGATGDGAIVAAQTIELGGRQVPIRFELAVGRDKLVAGRQYRLLGRILAAAGPAWISQRVPVDVMAGKVDLGTLVMTQAPRDVTATRLRCGEQLVAVDFSRDPARLSIGSETFDMRAVPAASGAKYEALGDPATTLWNKGASTTLVLRGKTYPECSAAGGEPVSLLQGEWVVEEIDNAGIIGGSRVTLNFDAEGRVAGKSSCNSYSGRVVLSGEGLRIGPIAATMMACEPPLMEQEQAFLALLQAVRRFELGADDVLLLISEDQRKIRASRM